MARPKEFNPDVALRALQKTFWEKGYHGTSMQDLESATGLKKQSLYREFGNKDAMYEQSLALYRDQDIVKLATLFLQATTARDRFRDMFDAILAPVRDGDRLGCFICNAAIDHAGEDHATMQTVCVGIQDTTALFDKALTASAVYNKNVSLRRETAISLTAGYFGLRVMVRGGIPPEELQVTADILVQSIER
ncbi:TetR/AcrR family transcriptional regulator [Sedimentitalea sp. CY04]|uniref:TetR/AcrR family transcriptional regulator n=1 Tax=Parasedimentitalea denitrificans TaxID=2211118 RepID=A0ABX0WEM2_9RHOB|nr:TetR/AcrR family transcriptional regulator [Sedimentitalea sp. CY04]NIZ63244.1 TetR/AcrR family transcriptional regulator [Sedimentitalea sp. CY04]